MRPTLRFGIRLGNCAELAPKLILELVRTARDQGLSSFWFPEHFLPAQGYFPSLQDDKILDPFELIAFIADASGDMNLGTAVALAPFHHPVQLAKRITTLAHLTDGRLILGLGVGWAPEEFRAFGYDKASRGKRSDELIGALKKLLAGAPCHHSGPHFVVDVPARREVTWPRTPIWGSGGGIGSEFAVVGQTQMSTAVGNRLTQLEGWITRPTTTPESLRNDRITLGISATDISEGFTIANVNFGILSSERAPLPDAQIQAAYTRHFGVWPGASVKSGPHLIGSVTEVAEKVAKLKSAGVSHFICDILVPEASQVCAWAEVADLVQQHG